MDIELYRYRNAADSVTVRASLTDGKLTVSGQDFGPNVEKWFGRDEYEYVVSLDVKNTGKLFSLLGCEKSPDETRLQAVKESFGNGLATTTLMGYCRQHEIVYSFWCWP